MQKRWLVVLRLGRINIQDKIQKSRDIITAMTGNEYFEAQPPENPSLSDLTTITNETESAFTNRTGTKESTANYRQKEFDLVTALNSMGNYVENIANGDTEIGDTIIFSAKMDVKFSRPRAPQIFDVKNLELSGSVLALAPVSGTRVAYEWEYSMDNENWSRAGTTTVASKRIDNLTIAERYYFRVAAVISGERQNWQGPINIIVT